MTQSVRKRKPTFRNRLSARWARIRSRAWDVAIILDLALIVAIYAFVAWQGFRGHLPDAPSGDFVAGGLLIFVVLAVVPCLYWRRKRVRSWREVAEYLHLKKAWPELGWGVLTGFAIIAILAVVGWVFVHFGWQSPRGPGRALSWSAILLLAALSGVGEEVFFRGFLQNHTRIWIQAVLFTAAHLPFEGILQGATYLGIGFGFGYIVKRRGSLYLPIGAHVTFNAIQLIVAKLTA